ncbi:MAG: protein-disulfide reductase DsbD family protein [Kiritimatiellae bacterium]|nr:protein-disulfide reductase DsbD family protein [Kiritimatiellia bacterium]
MWTRCRFCSGMVLAALALAATVGAAEETAPTVRVSLVLAVSRFAPGRPFDVAVRLEVPEGWHIYWRNPGDSGLATELVWELPTGFQAGAPEWPVPKRFTDGGLASFGYEGTVRIPVRIQPPSDWPSGRVARLRVRVHWLQCRDVCIPGSAEAEQEIPAGPSAIEAPAGAAELREARERLPRRWPDVAAVFETTGDQIRVHLRGLRAGTPALVLPYEGAFLPAAATPRWVRGGIGEWFADLPRAAGFSVPPVWAAVLLLEEGGGLELEIRGGRDTVKDK